MKVAPFFLLGFSLVVIACSGAGGSKAVFHPDVGPFDENGDYVVALADAPVKKNYFARNEKKSSRSSRTRTAARGTRPKRNVAQVRPPIVPSTPVIVPSAPLRRPPIAATAPRTVVITPSPSGAVVQPRPVVQPVQTVATLPPAPKPRTQVVKPKKKAPRQHRVSRSDTLYGLSRRYGVSVGSIQRANRLRGTTIITGSTLLIPR